MSEKNKLKCEYCGDAYVNHGFVLFGGYLSALIDPMFQKMNKLLPDCMIRFVDIFLKFLFNIHLFLRVIKLSENVEKANTLRSKVIWEEAIKRGIKMSQVVFMGIYTDNYRAKINGEYVYFDSLPIPDSMNTLRKNWDNKYYFKKHFMTQDLPVPKYFKVSLFKNKRKQLFDKIDKPFIVKPQEGSRGRHTTTHIYNIEDFEKAYKIARQLSPAIVMEEQLMGYVCRATCVNGKLAGFYRAEPASVIGDGIHTIEELVVLKNENKPERVSAVEINTEIKEHIGRLGLKIDDVLPKDKKIFLSYRIGRLFGGVTREMLDELHPSFVPVLEKASQFTKLPVVGLDCIIIDPESDEKTQKWGIIECNTLPFIDLHYFALFGKPKNIAGMVWDLWK
ncbi:MAG: hypothetical protein K9L98_01965 [Candidatus Pacebacteria bacterium]|nr:hypothetical protein [Candidatus Paceibacterota bacterium]MCF7862753.1 hypothetical protein [Candidatus Paceibacterota bacterium]